MTIDKIPVDSVDAELKEFEFTYVIADPSASTYPVSINVMNAFTIKSVSYVLYDEALNTTASIDVNGTAATGYTSLDVTDDPVRETTADVSLAAEDTLEITLATVLGTPSMIAFTFHCEVA